MDDDDTTMLLQEVVDKLAVVTARLDRLENPRPAKAATPTLPAAFSNNPNTGSSYNGPPSAPGGGATSFGLPGVPIDGVKRDSEGAVITGKPAEAAPLVHRTAAHQLSVEIADKMLPLKGQ